eukprot:Gb_14524 [translate_table: standard]
MSRCLLAISQAPCDLSFEERIGPSMAFMYLVTTWLDQGDGSVAKTHSTFILLGSPILSWKPLQLSGIRCYQEGVPPFLETYLQPETSRKPSKGHDDEPGWRTHGIPKQAFIISRKKCFGACVASRRNDDKEKNLLMEVFLVYSHPEEPCCRNIVLLSCLFLLLAMATRSFWVTEGVEDHLDLYAQEWEQFIIENANDKMVQVNEGLVNHITGMPLHGNKIYLREEARSMGREVILRLIGVEATPSEDQIGLLGDTSLSAKDEILESVRETVVSEIDKGQSEGRPPKPVGKELEAYKALIIFHRPNFPNVDELPPTTGPSQGHEELIATIPSTSLSIVPLGLSLLHTSPQNHHESPPRGTSDVEQF